MSTLAYRLPYGTTKPTGYVQFGNRAIIYGKDFRPVVLAASNLDATVKGFPCGIKAPTSGLRAYSSTTDAEFLEANTQYFFVYAYWSSSRGIMSQISPVTSFTTGNTPKKIVLENFAAPRDGAVAAEIDGILVGVQVGTSTNYMCVWGQTTAFSTDYQVGYNLSTGGGLSNSLQIVIDISAPDLEQGFPIDFASLYSEIPPAVGYAARYGERIWIGGQRDSVSPGGALSVTKSFQTQLGASLVATNTSITVDSTTGFVVGDTFKLNQGADGNAQEIVTVKSVDSSTAFTASYGVSNSWQINEYATRVFRGQKVAKLSLSGADFDDSHLHMSVYYQGRYLGEVMDVQDRGTAWLDRDVPDDLDAVTEWHLEGHDDRVWCSSIHNYTPGNVVTSYPESINLADQQLISPVLDGGETMKGVYSTQDALMILMNQSVVLMTGGTEVPTPAPYMRTDFGSVGPVAQRSITLSDSGQVFWVAEEGPALGAAGSIQAFSRDLKIFRLFHDSRWLAASDLSEMVAVYSRRMEGFLLGNFSINGTANYWGLISLRPQVGLWLFSGQEMSSNILVYPDSNGQERILVGDSYNGRIKRLFDPSVLTDLPSASDTGAAYTSVWRGGWATAPDGQPQSVSFVRFPGLICPDTSTFSMDLILWGSNHPDRNEADLPSGYNSTKSLVFTDLLLDLAMGGLSKRYYSLGLSWSSTAGATAPRAIEPTWLRVSFGGE